MKILNRYIFRQFAKTFLFTCAAFVVLFMLINMVEKLDKFMDRNLGFMEIARYYLLSIPSTLLVTSPVGVLLSSILVAGKLSASSELPAIRSAGVSMRQLLIPFVTGGVIICCLNLFNACWLAPEAFTSINTFEEHLQKNSDLPQKKETLHILESGNRIVSIKDFDAARLNASEVSVEEFNGSQLRMRTDAESMHYDASSGEWIMQNTSTRFFTGNSEQLKKAAQEPIKLSLTPQSLDELNLQPDEMNIVRHYNYLVDKEKAGFSGLERSMVKLHSKIALPFASIIIILIGVPLSAKKKRGGLASEISITLFIGFLFLALQKTIAIAGYQGIINPMLAAWLPNILFLGIGYTIYKTAID
ncbi:MAG: LPS export ABC transporter permease LptG [Chlorobium sp.]|jgi:lipopolysaccharide export system permease protein|nr:MAG: LPS export ABC transporter permease LptG [Chlorobium sp.]